MPPIRSVTVVPASRSQSPIAPRRSEASVASVSASRTISDEDLQRHILVRLSKLGPRVSRNIRPLVRRGEVQLTGAIGSEYERQFILHVIGQVAGIRHLT